MKMKKAVAAVLALSLAAGAAGCSKVRSVSGEDIVNVCDDMDFEEFDPDDNNDFDEDSLEDGFYFVMDQDYIEENLQGYASAAIRMSGLDLGIDFENIEEATVFGRVVIDGEDDVEDPEDLEDVEADALVGVQITLEEYDDDTFDDIADGIDDLLRKIGVDIDDLSSSEFKQNKDSLYLKINVGVAEFMEAFLDSEMWEAITDNADEDDEVEEVEEAFRALTGSVGVEIFVADGNILIVAAGSLNCEPEIADEFCSAIHVDNPGRLPNCQVVIDGIIEEIDDYADMVGGYYSPDDLIDGFSYASF